MCVTGAGLIWRPGHLVSEEMGSRVWGRGTGYRRPWSALGGAVCPGRLLVPKDQVGMAGLVSSLEADRQCVPPPLFSELSQQSNQSPYLFLQLPSEPCDQPTHVSAFYLRCVTTFPNFMGAHGLRGGSDHAWGLFQESSHTADGGL